MPWQFTEQIEPLSIKSGKRIFMLSIMYNKIVRTCIYLYRHWHYRHIDTFFSISANDNIANTVFEYRHIGTLYQYRNIGKHFSCRYGDIWLLPFGDISAKIYEILSYENIDDHQYQHIGKNVISVSPYKIVPSGDKSNKTLRSIKFLFCLSFCLLR